MAFCFSSHMTSEKVTQCCLLNITPTKLIEIRKVRESYFCFNFMNKFTRSCLFIIIIIFFFYFYKISVKCSTTWCPSTAWYDCHTSKVCGIEIKSLSSSCVLDDMWHMTFVWWSHKKVSHILILEFGFFFFFARQVINLNGLVAFWFYV